MPIWGHKKKKKISKYFNAQFLSLIKSLEYLYPRHIFCSSVFVCRMNILSTDTTYREIVTYNNRLFMTNR